MLPEVRSCNTNSTPPALPKPSTAGLRKIRNSPRTLPFISFSILCITSLMSETAPRSLGFFSVIKPIAALGEAPEPNKLKPETVLMLFTSGIAFTSSVAFSISLFINWRLAPACRLTTKVRLLSSSSGTKPFCVLFIRKNAPNETSARAPIAAIFFFPKNLTALMYLSVNRSKPALNASANRRVNFRFSPPSPW